MNIICIDTETGGLNSKRSAICSITLKKVDSTAIKTIYVKPTELEYNDRAMEINGLTKEFLNKHGVSEKEAINQIKYFIDINKDFSPPTMLAHNAIFDIQFLNEMFTRHSTIQFMDYMHYHPMDTMIIMKFLKQSGKINIDSVSLKACYRYFFNKDFKHAHTSEADVLATEQVYFKINEFFKECIK